MKISQKGLYALQALMMLARHHQQGAIKIREIAYEESLPEKFLELILLELKNARLVANLRVLNEQMRELLENSAVLNRELGESNERLRQMDKVKTDFSFMNGQFELSGMGTKKK